MRILIAAIVIGILAGLWQRHAERAALRRTNARLTAILVDSQAADAAAGRAFDELAAKRRAERTKQAERLDRWLDPNHFAA